MEKTPQNILSKDLQTMNEKQFEELFCYYYPKLVAYTAAILNDRTVAEDMVQEVFLYVWEKRKNLRINDSRFYSYLFQSAHSRCIDYFKKNKQSEKYVQQSLLNFAEEYRSYLDDDCSALQDIYSQSFTQNLNALLHRLPEARRTAFELTYQQGLKAKEVAAIMNIPQRTVESHIYLTLKYLKKHLSSSDFLLLSIL